MDKEDERLTPTQRRALEILRDHGPMMPKVFAEYMWPDSPAWQHHIKCGYGVHQGGGMYLAAGGYIGKLCQRGWVRPVRGPDRRFWRNEYGLSPAGREALK